MSKSKAEPGAAEGLPSEEVAAASANLFVSEVLDRAEELGMAGIVVGVACRCEGGLVLNGGHAGSREALFRLLIPTVVKVAKDLDG